jgi:hypothetical protein
MVCQEISFKRAPHIHLPVHQEVVYCQQMRLGEKAVRDSYFAHKSPSGLWSARMTRTAMLLILVAILLITQGQPRIHSDGSGDREGALSRLGIDLRVLYEEHEASLASPRFIIARYQNAPQPPAPANPLLKIADGKALASGIDDNNGENGDERNNRDPVDLQFKVGTINQGNTFSGPGSFTDLDSTSWTLTVDYGDGSPLMVIAATSTSFSLSHTYHTYPSTGEYTITVTVDDGGGGTSKSKGVTVLNVLPTLPGQSSPAHDLDGDGLAEDINGNGQNDFNDVVLLFQHLKSPEVENNPEDFDFNGSGGIAFDDIVALFQNFQN